MESQGDGAGGPPREGRAKRHRGRLVVEDAGRERPFMRGIMIHSLMARGVPFDDAYRTANFVREKLSIRQRVSKLELAKAVEELLGPIPEGRSGPLDIRVSDAQRRAHPFSKGLLSQSLLAAAIDPNDAFDVARDIEAQLVERRVTEIDRQELRRLAYEALARRIGDETAERYLAWRGYQEPEQPVILMLGGAAGVGKTSLALEVAHRLGIGRVLSTDSIRQIMRISLSPEIAPAIHGSSYDCYKLLPPDSLGSDPVITGFRAQSQTVSVGVRASMDRAVAENASVVLDGVSLVPGGIDLDDYTGAAHVIFLVVATLDEDSFRDRFETRAESERLRTPHRYLEHFEEILRIQDYLLELADRHDVPIVDNVSFDQSVLLIIRHVAETLRRQEDVRAADAP